MEYKEPYKHKEKAILKQIDLECPNCGKDIAGEHVNINSTLARCQHCNTISFLDDEDFFGKPRRAGRPEMMIPEGTEVLPLPSSLDIRVKWKNSNSRGGLWFLMLFAFMWNIIILPMAYGLIVSGGIMALLPMIFHLGAGLGMIYYLVTAFFNYTDVYITDSDLTISSKPLKTFWSRDIVLPSKDIKQLYVSKYVSTIVNGQPNYAYALYAITKQERRVRLIEGMNKETQLYLEQEIERYLDLEDVPVGNEVLS